MTKRPYNFGEQYILRQMRLGYVTYIIHPGQGVIIHVRGTQPMYAAKP